MFEAIFNCFLWLFNFCRFGAKRIADHGEQVVNFIVVNFGLELLLVRNAIIFGSINFFKPFNRLVILAIELHLIGFKYGVFE